jgi:hypothetical protein
VTCAAALAQNKLIAVAAANRVARISSLPHDFLAVRIKLSVPQNEVHACRGMRGGGRKITTWHRANNLPSWRGAGEPRDLGLEMR